MSLDAHAAGRSVLSQLTEDVDLPLKAIPDFVISTVVDGVIRAWRSIPCACRNVDEPALNAMLEVHLTRLSDDDQRLRNIVSAVARGAESVSVSGASIEKRPDISLTLRDEVRGKAFPLNIESKIIDQGKGKGIDLYCDKGLKRFVDGEYSWARNEALMVAYVRDSSTIVGSLTPRLTRFRLAHLDPYATVSLPVTMSGPEDQAQSSHKRSFRYPGHAQKTPGDIAIRHVWLAAQADNPVAGTDFS